MASQYGGYTGQILRVNLTTRTLDIEPTDNYLPQCIGGRGIAARIAWNEIKPDMTAFSPETPLIFMTGPLTGTMAPFSGRTTVCGLAPQGHPHEWYTRSSFGGHWGPELKYAGFDGIVITGRASEPVYLEINNGKCQIQDARALWGIGLVDVQKLLISHLGPNWRVFSIGPAGENLVRVAVGATETESASGQGGFGAVMGSKNLKAIAVRGTGAISIARPERFQQVCSWIRDEAHGSHGWPHTPRLDPMMVKKYGQRFQACTQGCAVRCFDARYYTRVPSKLCKGKYLSGQVDCIAGLFPGFSGSFYDWNLGFEAGFEIAQLTNNEGLNHWEFLVGTMPWLRQLKQDGTLRRFNKCDIDLDDVHFWRDVVMGISRREGEMGEALAEGTVRGAEKLGIGQKRLGELFPAWGYAGHWDGHGDHINKIFFPFWIVAALQWAMDTRDPISSGHGYVQNIMGWCHEHSPVHGISWDRIINVTSRIYGSKLSGDPRSGYADKAFPAYWHGHRSVAKDSLPVDDQVFPRVFSKRTEDNFARAGDLEGPQFEYAMFTAATGIDWTEAEYEHYLERVIHQERQLLIRNFNRSRNDDETLIPYLERPENLINPYIGHAESLDREAFRKVMDEYYQLRGWDIVTGHPTAETLKKFGLTD